MLKIEHVETFGFESAIRGMRNPMNSWDKSDSYYINKTLKKEDIAPGVESLVYVPCKPYFKIGPNDHDLAMRLRNAGTDHRKFMRMIVVYADITAPLYWWKEYDTYKVGTVANSCSTMHKITEKEFTIDDFSHEHLTGETDGLWVNADGRDFMCSALDFIQIICDVLNHYRERYFEADNKLKRNDLTESERKHTTAQKKHFWWQIIQLLPSSYNQRRTVMLTYEVLANMHKSRRYHKLDEWRTFCDWIESLPYSELITGKVETKNIYICDESVSAICPVCDGFVSAPNCNEMNLVICPKCQTPLIVKTTCDGNGGFFVDASIDKGD